MLFFGVAPEKGAGKDYISPNGKGLIVTIAMRHYICRHATPKIGED
jgi:hypothetical protein